MYLCDCCKLLKEIDKLIINSYPHTALYSNSRKNLPFLFLNINANKSNTCKILEKSKLQLPLISKNEI